METRTIALTIILGGVLLVVVGLLVLGGWFGWFGRLPGDLRVERQGVRIYVPVLSMIIVSVVLSLLFAALRRLL
jgi:uncharacterized membrane protein